MASLKLTKQRAQESGWHLDSDHWEDVAEIWGHEGLRPLVQKWAGTYGRSDGAQEVFWELCLAAHLCRSRIAKGVTYEASLGEGLKTVDFQVTDDLYVELTTKSQPGKMPAFGDLWDLNDDFASHVPARDFQVTLTKHCNWKRDKPLFIAELDRVLPTCPPGHSFAIEQSGQRIATVTPHETAFREVGWVFSGGMQQEEQYRTTHGLSKDQAQLREAIRHGIDKLPQDFRGCLLIGIACLNGYFAFRNESAMNEMLFEGFIDRDPQTGHTIGSYPGLSSEFAGHAHRIRIGIYEGHWPELSRFNGLKLYDIVPRLNVVSGFSARRTDDVLSYIERTP
jgi:hypothetical protein